ncbi:PREDICTED: trypsin inhibitor BvTI-like [Camelina sativa]|uniref:Trypsin inhibitor BvTI-like n=1 Tax=Camelina sativa TaxID=90675 RepID=A0ABM0TLS3_CAMSA|nr:PREDICTED: trypsin inhibitor BvTI-like [Camelina sativa]
MNPPMFYFLFALTTVLAATIANAQPVLDTDGDIIFGGSYYVLPVIRGQGGGLTLAGRGDQPCPLDIVQESSEVDEGIPVKFSNWRSKVGFVPESANLNIETEVAATICVQSAYWWVDENAKFRVTAGPKPDELVKESYLSFFQIQNVYDHFYQFAFCPTGPKSCSDVGVFVDENGVRRLALTKRADNTPFLVMFKKANVPENSSKIMSII